MNERRAAATTLELSIPADPALALTARIFAGAVSRYLAGESPDDLKLALSELLAGAIEAGAAEVAFRVDVDRQEVSAQGAGGGVTGLGGAEEDDERRMARTSRAALLSALFPGMRTEGDIVILPLRGSSA